MKRAHGLLLARLLAALPHGYALRRRRGGLRAFHKMAPLLSPVGNLDANAPFVERVRFALWQLWRNDLPPDVPDDTDPPVVGRRVTDEQGVEPPAQPRGR